jgi:hypothetical protein
MWHNVQGCFFIFFVLFVILVFPLVMEIQSSRGECWDPINRFNPTAFLNNLAHYATYSLPLKKNTHNHKHEWQPKDGQYNSRSYFTKRTHTITNMNDNLKMDNTIAGHIIVLSIVRLSFMFVIVCVLLVKYDLLLYCPSLGCQHINAHGVNHFSHYKQFLIVRKNVFTT